jgi:hypothetical protein
MPDDELHVGPHEDHREVCHDPLHHDLLRLLALRREHLRLHVLPLPQRGGPARRRGALLLRQRVRLRRLRLPAELRLRRLSGTPQWLIADDATNSASSFKGAAAPFKWTDPRCGYSYATSTPRHATARHGTPRHATARGARNPDRPAARFPCPPPGVERTMPARRAAC